MEILKQPQYAPMPVEQQVLSIYTVTNGHLDDVPVNRVREWERQFHEFVTARFPQITENLRTEKVLSKDTEAELKKAVDAFKQTFAK